MVITALFLTVQRWKQPKCPTAGEWINKMRYNYTMEYYSAIKRYDVLNPATTWVTLENIMLSERRQTQRTHMVSFHLYEMSTTGKSIETERLVAARVL